MSNTVYVIADDNATPPSIFQRFEVPKHCVMRLETPEEAARRKVREAESEAYSKQLIDEILLEEAVEKRAQEELRAQPWDIQCSQKDEVLKLVQEYFADTEYYHSHSLNGGHALLAKYNATNKGGRHRDNPSKFAKESDPLATIAFLALLRKQHYRRCPVDRNTDLGTFNVVSRSLHLSDPCYQDISSGVTLSGVRQGTWHAQVRHACDWGLRPFFVGAFHESYEGGIPLVKGDLWSLENENGWKRAQGDVGVDSGQAGIFDAKLYGSNEAVKETPKWKADEGAGGLWYAACCDATIENQVGAGLVPGGVVSRSGHGDGGYSAYYRTKGGEVVAVFIDFLGMMRDEEEKE
jgi:hypothetical protein